MTDQRKAYMDFTTVPVKLTELSIFARRGSFENFRGLEDLKGKTVGIRRGFKMPPVMQTMFNQGNIRLEEVNTDLQNFEKLSRDRIQAILSNREVGLETLEALGNTDIVAFMLKSNDLPSGSRELSTGNLKAINFDSAKPVSKHARK